MTVNTLVNKLATNKKIFLLDGLGALLTTILLLLLLRFPQWAGMPIIILKVLATIAVCFAIYSLCCFLLLQQKKEVYLFLIAIANSMYCLVTLLLMMLYCKKITPWGVFYFATECYVIAILVFLEIKIALLWKKNI